MSAPGGMRIKLRPKGPMLFRPPRACPAGEEVRINPAGAQERGVFATEMARGEAAWSFLAHHHACISTRLSFLNFCLRWGKPTGGQPRGNCGPFVMTFALLGLSLTRMPPGAIRQLRLAPVLRELAREECDSPRMNRIGKPMEFSQWLLVVI